MKFVKGDAIAGVIVLAVNIVGGLIIGIVQRGLPAGVAAHTYTLLTIGEGLVAQIPALLISTGAGIVVTRVAAEDNGPGAHLGQEIAGQILGQPKAIAMAAGLLGGLALVPGLPFFPFVLLAAVLGFVAWSLLRRGRRASGPEKPREATATLTTGPLVVPISIELGQGLGQVLCPDGDVGPCAARLADTLRDRAFAELGIPLPALGVCVAAELEDDAYVIRFNDVPLRRGNIPPTAGAETELATGVLALLRRYGHEFVDIQATQRLLDGLSQTHPALVREVVPKLIAPPLLAEVLRRLVEEGVSLRHLAEVLTALAAAPAAERDPLLLTERVRGALRRTLSHRHAAADGRLPVLTLEPMIEDAVRDAIHKTMEGSTLALEPQLSRDIVDAVGRALAATPGASVILTNADIRRYVRRLLEAEHPGLAVLSYPELAPEARVQMLGQIRIG